MNLFTPNFLHSFVAELGIRHIQSTDQNNFFNKLVISNTRKNKLCTLNPDLKLNIQKTKIMESSPITSWQIDGETVETVADFILGGSKITADGDRSHEIKACNAGDPSSIPGLGRSLGERKGYPFQDSWVSLVAQTVKNLPAIQETWVRSLGWEDLLEKGKATHSSILAWRIPWTV